MNDNILPPSSYHEYKFDETYVYITVAYLHL